MIKISVRLQNFGLALLALAGGYLTWIVGHRGIHLLDQCMVFDGGWRVLSGEQPYRDFGAPFPPFTFWLQALSFSVLGVNWSATVAPATLLNVLIVPFSWHTYQRLFRGRTAVAPWMFAVFSALLLYPPFGTLWFEVNGLFFIVVSMFFLVRQGGRGWHGIGCDAAAGVFCFVAFLCKQNVFLFYAPLLLVILIASRENWNERWRSIAIFSLGNFLAFGVFLGWTGSIGALEQTKFYLLDLPREIALERLKPGGAPNRLSTFKWVVIGATLATTLLSLAWLRQRSHTSREFRYLPLVNLVMLASWVLITTTTANDGFVLALGLAMVMTLQMGIVELMAADPGALCASILPCRILLAVCRTAIALAAIGVVAVSMPRVLKRESQGFLPSTRFDQRMTVPGLQSLWWANPTEVTWQDTGVRVALQPSDLAGVYKYLSNHEGNFYVWGDSTLFYGLLGRRSAPPILYFGVNHSYLARDTAELDRIMLERFQKLNIRRIVRERAHTIGLGLNELHRFPETYRWVMENFISTQKIGIYEIFEKRPDSFSTSK